MNEVKYEKAIAESTYKTVIRNVLSTDSNKAWFEETGEAYPRADAKTIWRDYQYVPETPEKDKELFEVFIKNDRVPIYKHITQLKLDKVPGTRWDYDSPEFKNVITKENYIVELYDADKEQIPFGLNRWHFDSIQGRLSFLSGFPEGYNADCLYISFYRYEGRNLLDTSLSPTGEIPMSEGYSPELPNDIANKDYVDKKITATDDTVSLLKPPVPPLFTDKELEFICDEAFPSTYLKTGDKIEHTVLPDTSFIIRTPKFYNPGKGKVELTINGLTYATWYLDNSDEELGGSTLTSVQYNDDYYKDDLIADGFYKGLILQFEGTAKELPQVFLAPSVLTFQFRYTSSIDTYYSKSLLVGWDDEPKLNAITDSHFRFEMNDNFYWDYVSGVPTPRAGSKLLFKKFINKTLNKFSTEDIIGSYRVLGQDFPYTFEGPYGTHYPEVEYTDIVEVPDNYYEENLTIQANSYDILHQENGQYEEEFRFRVDTVSNEDNRVTSGFRTGKSIESAGAKWNPQIDLTNTTELQALNGKYTWPITDYSKNGKLDIVTQFGGESWIKPGPDYSKCKKEGTRCATFKYEIDTPTNGVYICMPGIPQDELTKAFKFKSMMIKIEDQTDWLDVSSAYSGWGTPVNFGTPALAVSQSMLSTIYCTFGPKPRKGTLLVRIEKTKDEPDFEEPIVNIKE